MSMTVTPVKVAVPQFEIEPDTWKDPALCRIVVGPHTLLTVMQAVLVTRVVQGPELPVAGPHEPLPVTVNLSLLGPQLVTVIVRGPNGTALRAGTVPMLTGTEITAPLALVIQSVTTTSVSGSEPQLVTEPETV